jgi:hypothetical protein
MSSGRTVSKLEMKINEIREFIELAHKDKSKIPSSLLKNIETIVNDLEGMTGLTVSLQFRLKQKIESIIDKLEPEVETSELFGSFNTLFNELHELVLDMQIGGVISENFKNTSTSTVIHKLPIMEKKQNTLQNSSVSFSPKMDEKKISVASIPKINKLPIKFPYNNLKEIVEIIKEAKKIAAHWDHEKLTPAILEMLDKMFKFGQEYTQNKLIENEKEIASLRESLEVLIIKTELTVSERKDILPVDRAPEKIKLQSDLLKNLNHLREKSFNPGPIGFSPLEDPSLAKKALAELVNHFDFYMAAFNTNYSDPFQDWAFMNEDMIEGYSEKLFEALEADEGYKMYQGHYGIDLAPYEISRLYDVFYDAAKTNNPQLLLSDGLYSSEKKVSDRRFKEHFSNVLVKNASESKLIAEEWRKFSEKTFEKKYKSILKSVKKHYLFYESLLTDHITVSFFSKLKALGVFQIVLNALHSNETQYSRMFNTQRNIELKNIFKKIKDSKDKKDDKNVMLNALHLEIRNALYLGKGQLKYINWQLVDMLHYFTSGDGKVIMKAWEKEQRHRPSCSPATLTKK